MNQKVKLGIIGFGRIVELVHLPILKKLPEIEVSGIYDITPQRLELAARRGFRTYSQLEALLDSGIDAVLIATPPSSHFPIAVQALQKGKHLLVEKPVTETAAEAIHLAKLSEECGKSVTVFQNRRFDKDYLYVKGILDEEKLGQIMFVDRKYHMFGSGASFGVKSFHPEWRNKKGYGGGALLDWGVHLIDQLLQLQLGKCEQLNAVMYSLCCAQGNADDYVHASFRLDNGIVMMMEINFGSNAPVPLWTIGGEKATLQVSSTGEAVLLEKGRAPQHSKIELPVGEGAEQIYSSWAGRILRNEKLAVQLEEAVATMKIIDAIRKSKLN